MIIGAMNQMLQETIPAWPVKRDVELRYGILFELAKHEAVCPVHGESSSHFRFVSLSLARIYAVASISLIWLLQDSATLLQPGQITRRTILVNPASDILCGLVGIQQIAVLPGFDLSVAVSKR